jgi:hypothetical protein
MNVTFGLDTYELLFVILNKEHTTIINQSKFTLLMARYHILKGKTNGDPPDLYNLLFTCSTALMLECEIRASRNKLDKFQRVWGQISDSL